MVKHIHTLLQRRDETYSSGSNWVLEEAMNMRNLHIGGTFKNALARRIDDVVIPLFAKVIAVIDRNRNLHHLYGLGKKQCSIHDLWLMIFNNPKVLGLNYEEIAGQDRTPVADDFHCNFPFSWLIKEVIETQWECVKNTSGNSTNNVVYDQAIWRKIFFVDIYHKYVVGHLKKVKKAYSYSVWSSQLFRSLRSVSANPT